MVFRIANDSFDPKARSAPLVIFVPAANPLARLTFAQLEQIFATHDSGLRWGEVGVMGDFADRPVHPYGLAATTALGRFMRQHALAGHAFDNVHRPAGVG